jgi:hypothetical protein
MIRAILLVAAMLMAVTTVAAVAPSALAGPDPLMQTASGGGHVTGSSLTMVPEPATLCVLALGSAAILAGRRRARSH